MLIPMLDARPGFIIKFLKRSLIVKLVSLYLSKTAVTLPVEDCRLAVESSCFK